MSNVVSIESDKERNWSVVGQKNSQVRNAEKQESMVIKARVFRLLLIYGNPRNFL